MSKTIIEENVQIVIFSLFNSESDKKEKFGVLIDHIKEIRPVESIIPLPRSKDYVCGMMNLRGSIIPVIDIKRKMGFSNNDNPVNPDCRILVVDIVGQLIGLLINEVDQVKRITAKDIETNLSGKLGSFEYLMGITKISGHLVLLLDVENLVRDTSCGKEV
ncbi:MAG: chemotaxis protein CheW [Nitrososphaera sp.]|jgi:purine-binding chemotaxis protein CheW